MIENFCGMCIAGIGAIAGVGTVAGSTKVDKKYKKNVFIAGVVVSVISILYLLYLYMYNCNQCSR
jgi:small basic protein